MAAISYRAGAARPLLSVLAVPLADTCGSQRVSRRRAGYRGGACLPLDPAVVPFGPRFSRSKTPWSRGAPCV